ncbi:MAG: hypothetical protein ACQESE_01020 [Nanobdellota archaeon]
MGLGYRVKTYFSFTGKENRNLFLTSLVMTMALFFYLWAKYPDKDIMLSSGPISLVNIIILFILTYAMLFIMIATGKFVAIMKKYTAEYTSWFNGLLIGFVVTFASYGYFPVVFPGLITLTKNERLRYGKPQPGENKRAIFWTLAISLGSIALLAIVFQQLFMHTGSIIFQGAKDIASFILIYSVLPFPNNYGSHMFYTKKKRYFIYSFFLIILSLAIIFNSAYSLAIGIAGGALLWLIFSKFLGKHFFGKL